MRVIKDEICRILAEEGETSIVRLTSEFGTTEAHIRHLLQQLNKEGFRTEEDEDENVYLVTSFWVPTAAIFGSFGFLFLAAWVINYVS
ncbi:hypothetical protein FZC76_21710 [Sutcliffiella horikoshii]|uniref:Uncharacterized protein n=1 Tax=Sutcliffiella horikoshii TaxID=79883 RepID=A0A5D4SB63_9BACI|nr:hypothetical protein [Sutcliffiella horikoshii]TYS60490.1 hypothetical protein FZC76_21710 [Sutcliffiella horikoshii]